VRIAADAYENSWVVRSVVWFGGQVVGYVVAEMINGFIAPRTKTIRVPVNSVQGEHEEL
jgi:hypothetical protein